jgi:hypothetical protein
VTYQIIYSSESRKPLQSNDLEEILEDARSRNGIEGISGALIYADRTFLQILEGDRAKVEALMDRIRSDARHENVTVLREGEIPVAKFAGWNMAYVGATPEQVARWSGIAVSTKTTDEVYDDLQRTARFAEDILALLGPEKPQ